MVSNEFLFWWQAFWWVAAIIGPFAGYRAGRWYRRHR